MLAKGKFLSSRYRQVGTWLSCFVKVRQKERKISQSSSYMHGHQNSFALKSVAPKPSISESAGGTFSHSASHSGIPAKHFFHGYKLFIEKYLGRLQNY